MGANVNVGAGTITCNYDGVNNILLKSPITLFYWLQNTSTGCHQSKVAEGATIAAVQPLPSMLARNS